MQLLNMQKLEDIKYVLQLLLIFIQWRPKFGLKYGAYGAGNI